MEGGLLDVLVWLFTSLKYLIFVKSFVGTLASGQRVSTIYIRYVYTICMYIKNYIYIVQNQQFKVNTAFLQRQLTDYVLCIMSECISKCMSDVSL